MNIRGYKPNTSVHMGQLKRALKMLKKAKKPAVPGRRRSEHCPGGERYLQKWSTKTNVPVCNNDYGTRRGADEPSALYRQPGNARTVCGKHGSGESVICCSPLETRFNDRITGKLHAFAPNAEIVHIDIGHCIHLQEHPCGMFRLFADAPGSSYKNE